MSFIQPGTLAAQPSDSKASIVSETQRKVKTTPLVSLISGSIAGGVEATITYPFEFAKTRAQLQSTASRSSNPLAVIPHTAREHGVRSIYTGCSTLVLGTACKAGVRFLSFDYIKNMLVDDNGSLSASRGILAGMIAGAVESVVAVTPTERIKTALYGRTMTNQNPKECVTLMLARIDDAKSGRRRFRGGIDALTIMVREKGISEIYRGLASTTIKQSTTSAVRMGTYNIVKEFMRAHKVPQNTITTFASGAAAGVVTVYATQPFDSIKTIAQSANGTSTREAFRRILHEKGVRGFWGGSTMRLGRLILSGGIVFSIYEQVAVLLTKYLGVGFGSTLLD